VRRPILLLALTVVLAGCGEDTSPEEEVRSTVTRFADASADKDYQVMCDELLAPALVTNVEQYGLPCELALKRGLGDVKAPKLTLGKVEVKGDRATARVTTTATGQEPSTDTLALRRLDDGWRIAALG
jgi:ketosteroid isomerase-like protein